MRIIYRTSGKKKHSAYQQLLYMGSRKRREREREKKVKSIFGEIIAEKFPNLKEESYI